jgi:hypothetical protein
MEVKLKKVQRLSCPSGQDVEQTNCTSHGGSNKRIEINVHRRASLSNAVGGELVDNATSWGM